MVIYTAVGNTTILKTYDSGENWSTLSTITARVELQSVIFNGQLGIAAGGIYNHPNYGAIVLKTINAGNNWDEMEVPELNNIYDLQFVNDSTIFFTASSGSFGMLFCQTTDTFNTWKAQTNFRNQAYETFEFYAVSADTIFGIIEILEETPAISSSIIKSTNSGLDWKSIKELPAWGYNEILINNDSGYLIGTVGVNGPITSSYGPVIFSSFDFGETWDLKTISYPFLDLFFINENKGFVTGGSDDIHFMSGELFITQDGGISWEIALITGGLSKPIQFLNEQTGFLLTYRKGIYKTEDGGSNWSQIYNQSNIRDMFFINETTGWICRSISDSTGYYTAIYSTIDGGVHWEAEYQQQQNNSYSGYKKIQMLDSDNGWAAGDAGLITKFKNGVWESIPHFTDLPINSLFFTDPNTGWASAGFNSINQILYSTADGGASWDSEVDLNYKIENIFFQDKNRGWIAGSDTLGKGMILLTENGGANWQVLIDDLIAPVYSLHFSQGQAWAAGGRGLILHSNDGINWMQYPIIIPNSTELYQNYPNPFNPSTIIEYKLVQTARVNLSVFNLLGQKVATLVSEKQPANTYKVEWEATGFASGVYFCRLKTDKGFVKTKKLVLLK